MQGRSIDVRVFLEGIEVPVVSFRLEGGVSIPATATIEIPAASEVHELKPRTLVHIFYAETRYAWQITDREVSKPASLNDRRNHSLLFVGEAVAYKFINVGNLRHAVLMCQDFTTYWQHAKLYWGTGKLSHTTYKRAITAGAVQVFDKSKKVDESDELLNLLMAKPVTIPKLTGVLGGVISLLEAATGVYRPEAAKNFRGVNDFMGQAELRLQLTQTLGAAPDDTTSAKFLDSRLFRQYLRRLSRSMSNQASFLDLVQLFLNRIYYTWTSVPMPPYLPRNEADKVRTKRLEVIRKKGKTSKTLTDLQKLIQGLDEEVQKRFDVRLQRVKNGSVSGGNAWGNEYQEYSADGKDFARDTAGHQAFANSLAVKQFLEKDFTAASAQIKSELGGKAFDARVGTAGDSLIDAQEALKVVTAQGPVTDTPGCSGLGYPNHTERNLQTISLSLRAAAARTGTTSTVTYRTVDERRFSLGDRLHCHMFLPDLYMAPPPTCNVLFPDQYAQIHFSRQWMSEITRLTMHTRTQSGQDAKDLYFAPNTSILKGPPAKDVEEAVTKGISFLMPHERFTGIIHTIEAIEEASIFKKIHQDVKKSAGEDKKYDPTSPPFASVSGEALYSPMEHLRRAANFLFFQKRFSGRTLTVVARFSPQVVPGLPMLILDGDPTGGRSEGDRPSTGTHFLGLVAGIQHSLDATGQLSTQITLTRCRTHTEGTDIFGSDADGVIQKTRTKRRVVRVRKNKQVVPLVGRNTQGLPPSPSEGTRFTEYKGPASKAQLGDYNLTVESAIQAAGFDPRKGARYSVQVREIPELVDLFVYDGQDEEIAPDALLGLQKRAAEQAKTREDAGYSDPYQAGNKSSPRVEIMVTEDRPAVRPNTYQFTFSFEQTATPPWFAEIYLPTQIGQQFYQPMLGCGSILDESAFSAGVADTEITIGSDDRVVLGVKMPDGSTKETEIPARVLDQPQTVQEAAEKLAETWRSLTDAGANIGLFVDEYTHRSSASISDIMGDRNPYLSLRPGSTLAGAEAGQVGFHGNAYGQFDGLKDLDGRQMSPDGLLPRAQPEPTKKGERASKEPTRGPVNPSADTRREKWDAVWQYQQRVMRFNGWMKEAKWNEGQDYPQPYEQGTGQEREMA